MKKLMTMIAAVATAFGLYAADADIAGINSFEDGNDAGVVGKKFTPANAEGWSFSGTETELDLDEYAGDKYTYPTTTVAGNVRRTEFTGSVNDQFLKLETGTEVLSLATKSTSIFADQVVKFTGFEEAPTLAADTKIAVWMSEEWNDDETVAETNLYVSAYDATEGSKNYLVGSANQYKLGKWYRLTVKSLGNVMSGSYAARLGFVVYIDGEMVGSEEAKIAIDVDTLKDDATKALATAGQLFPAITTDATFASVGYMGMGSVDDVVVDNQGPEFARSVDVSFAPITGATIAKVVDSKGNEFDNVSGTISVAQGNLTVTLAPAAGWKLADGKGTYVVSTLDALDGVITIEVDEGDLIEGYATLNGEVKGEDELADMMAGLVDNDVVEFIKDGNVTNGVDETPIYTFATGTKITVADGAWELNVVNTEAGPAVFGIYADIANDITATFESEDMVSLGAGITIAAGKTLDASDVNGMLVTEGAISVAGTLKVANGDGFGDTITLVEAGKVWSAEQLPYEGDDSIFTNEKVAEAGDAQSGYTYTIKAAPVTTGFMVIIGEQDPVYYNTLQDAINAAMGVENAKVVILEDCEIASTITVDDELSIELAEGVTVNTTADGQKAFLVIDDATLSVKGVTADDETATTFNGRFTVGKRVSGGHGIPGNLVIDGGSYAVTGEQTVIHVNGDCQGAYDDDCSVSVKDATITSLGDNAIQFNGKGTYSIVNSKVTGYTGIYLKAGTLTIDGTSEIAATGAKLAPSYHSNGSNKTGDAIVLDSVLGYKGQVSLDLAASAKVTSANGYAVIETITRGETSTTLRIADAGATLTGALGGISVTDEFDGEIVGYVAAVDGLCYKTAAEALAAVQAKEVGDDYIIKVAVFADDTTVVNGNQQIILGEGDAITITKNSWVFNNGVTISGTDPIALAEGATFTVVGKLATTYFSAPENFEVIETDNGDGTYTYSVAQKKDFGGGSGDEADPYIISAYDHFVELQEKVAAGNDFAGKYFKQTANIDFTDKDPWGGIGKKANTGSGNCFSGVYDGQGYEITGLKLVRGKTYNGLFTQVDGGTVKNLVVTLAGFGPATGAAGEEFGGAVIGNVCGGGLIENVTAKGFLGTVEAAPNHNVAGIAVSLMKGTLLNCTNEANVISAYTKVGGICAITQTATPRIIQGCVNKGTVRGVETFKTEQAVGGILAYSNSGEAEIIDCENYGSVVCDRETTQASCAFYEGQLCGQSQGAGGYITCKGVNKVLANQLAADASEKDASKAFSAGYATVDGDIATIIPVANLAAGNTYKLMVKGLTPAFVLAADGDTIAFNTNLCEAVAFNVTAGDVSLEVKETAAEGIVTFTAATKQFEVTFADGANSTISPTAGTAKYAYGAEVKITATADTGYKFDQEAYTGWTKDSDTVLSRTETITDTATFTAPDAVAAQKPVVDPTKPTEVKAKDAEEAKAMVDIVAPEAAGELTAAQLETYQGYFVKNATDKGDGKFEVSIELSTEGAAQLAEDSKITAEAGDTTITLTPAKVVPGFFYGVAQNQTLESIKTTAPAKWTVATADGLEAGALTVDKTEGAAKEFFVIKVSPTGK